MGYLKFDKKVNIEKYTANRFLLCIYGETEKRMINDTAYEIIIRFECIWHIPTAGFAEQNGRNAKLNGRLPFDY